MLALHAVFLLMGSGTGITVEPGVGSSVGISTVSGIGQSRFQSVASSIGTATVSAAGLARVQAAGTADGASTVTGVVTIPVLRLSWTCPTAVAEDIASYRIFYGTTSHADVLEPGSPSAATPYDFVATVNDPDATSFDISLDGIYCFRMTTVNSLGEESIFSDELVWSSGLTPPITLSAETL